MVFRIFISHSGRDLSSATAVATYLRQIPNTSIFLSEENIIAGNLSEGILSQIRSCDVFIVLYSSNSHNSQYVQNEIGAARIQNKVMIVLQLDSTLPTAMLQGITYYPIYDPNNSGNQLPMLYDYIKQQAQARADSDGAAALLIFGGVLLGLAYALSGQ